MTKPLSEADLIFPHLSNTPNLSSTLSSLRRSTLSIHNRLASIVHDSAFVASVATAYSLPLVANERCGSWYIPPDLKRGSVYFKSTDGHMGQWQFSLRRLNLQLLDVVQQRGGAVVVDSTRRGKSMPDALSKTVPIWCCVINRVVFGTEGDKGMLRTPPSVVGQSEYAQMDERIDGFVKSFLDVCKPDIASLRAKLQKPLRPIWVTQGSSLPDAAPSFSGFHPIVLCTASRRVQGAETSENGYVQGAADDHEAWAQGLTPALFWKHKDKLMSVNEDDAPALIEKIASEDGSNVSTATLIKPTTNLYIALSENIDLRPFEVVISCTPEPIDPTIIKAAKVSRYSFVRCRTGKLGSRDLRVELAQDIHDIARILSSVSGNILVCCPTGKDLSVGTALAILCLFTSDEGHIDATTKRDSTLLSKDFIKQRLSWITLSNPALNPSRATLQSVNSVLLSSHDPKVQSNITTSTFPTRPNPSSLGEPDNLPEQHTPSQPNNSLPTHIFTTWPQHTWTFKRTLTSALPTHPSGTVTGSATFTSCTPSSAHSEDMPPTLLYTEEGEFVTDTGFKFMARRKYVYQLVKSTEEEIGRKEAKEYIAVRFFDDEKMPRNIAGIGERGEGVGGPFVEMGPLTLTEREWEAENRERHLCAEDLYAAKWKFGAGMLRGSDGERWWEVRYDVSGPKKGYVSVTRYTVSK